MIKYPKRMKQLANFSGMQDGKMHPTDLDGLIEYKNKGWVMMEAKYNDKPVPKNNGQRIMMERFINDVSYKKKSVAIICDHYVDDTNEPYVMGECIVREIYHSKEKVWRQTKDTMTVQELVDSFIKTL